MPENPRRRRESAITHWRDADSAHDRRIYRRIYSAASSAFEADSFDRPFRFGIRFIPTKAWHDARFSQGSRLHAAPPIGVLQL
jgi:hypothetical protein